MKFFKTKAFMSLVIFTFFASLLFIYQDSLRWRHSPRPLSSEKTGVLFFDHWRTQDGYNVVNTYFEQPSCVVYTLRGDIVFRFPGGFCQFLQGGELLTLTESLQFYNHLGRLVWKVPEEFMHADADLSPEQTEFYLITGDARWENGHKVVYEAIRGYSLKGEKIFEWNLNQYVETYKKLIPWAEWRPIPAAKGYQQYAQFQSLQVIPANALEDHMPAFRRGNLLISDFRHSIVFILDPHNKKIVWSRTLAEKEFQGANSVRILPDGHMLYFFNNNEIVEKMNHSSVVEWDPSSQGVIWEYKTDPLDLLSISNYGSAFRLPNGNTLITHHSAGGGAFEINDQGRLVWQWSYPVLDNAGRSQPVYRVQRWPREPIDSIIRVWRKTFSGQ